MHELFRKLAAHISRLVGSIWTFILVIVGIIASGWYFNFSFSWTNSVTTAISISTLLILFFVQNSQNRGIKAIQLKLDELIRAIEGARNEMTAVEDKTELEMEQLIQEIID